MKKTLFFLIGIIIALVLFTIFHKPKMKELNYSPVQQVQSVEELPANTDQGKG